MRTVFADTDRPAPLQEADQVAQESSAPQPLPPSTAPDHVMVQQEGSPPPSPPLSVAPMMAWTDHHFRQLLRLLTRRTLLYTEMYPVDVVLEAAAAPRDGPMRHETAAPRGKATGEWKPTSLADRTHTALRQLLAFDPVQHPIAVQLGGRHPERMGEAARLCASFGFDQVNININLNPDPDPDPDPNPNPNPNPNPVPNPHPNPRSTSTSAARATRCAATDTARLKPYPYPYPYPYP